MVAVDCHEAVICFFFSFSFLLEAFLRLVGRLLTVGGIPVCFAFVCEKMVLW